MVLYLTIKGCYSLSSTIWFLLDKNSWKNRTRFFSLYKSPNLSFRWPKSWRFPDVRWDSCSLDSKHQHSQFALANLLSLELFPAQFCNPNHVRYCCFTFANIIWRYVFFFLIYLTIFFDIYLDLKVLVFAFFWWNVTIDMWHAIYELGHMTSTWPNGNCNPLI